MTKPPFVLPAERRIQPFLARGLDRGGELGRLIADFDWAATPLGPLDAWPSTLQAAVSTVVGSAVPMVVMWGSEGVMIYNDAYAVVVAGRHPHVLGARVEDAWPEARDFNAHVMARVLGAGETLKFEDQALALERNGRAEDVWMNLDYSLLLDDEGAPGGVLALVVETTGKVLAEEAARVQTAEFRSFAEALPNHVWSATSQGHLDWVNGNVVTYSGMGAGDVLGAGWADMVHRDDLAETARCWAAAREANEPYEVEFRLRRFDGAYRWHLSRALPLHDAAGAVVRWVGSNTDIEEQKRAAVVLGNVNLLLERQLAERTADRDRMWRLSTDMMLVADFDARIVSVNPAWTALLGWSQSELTGSLFLDFIHPDDMAATVAEVAAEAAGKTTTRFENRYRCRDGSYRRISWTAVSDEGFIHALGRDVTAEHDAAEALRRTEAALYQAQKMESVGQLTGGIAHDFNNLLQVVSANLQLLARRVAGDERNERYIASALGGVRRGARLASQLLAFARRQPLEPEVVDIGRLAMGMEELLRRTLGESVEIEVVASGGLWHTDVDRAQVENALLNLALNARDAMDGVGRLTIEVGNALLDDTYVRDFPGLQPGQYVVLTVTDTGAGIPPEIIGKVFEPFFSTKPDGKGTGLGLSMVYGFVKQSGGHVKVYSEVGHGTAVKIYLPRAVVDETAAASVPAVAGQGARISGLPADVDEGGGETVLVAEDDDDVRSAAVELLGQLGYRVLAARDASEALGIVERGVHVDLLFTDVVMPGPLRSPELARIASAVLPRLAVLFTSGYTQNAIVHGGRLDPGVELIGKPYTQQALAARIRRVLAAKKKRG